MNISIPPTIQKGMLRWVVIHPFPQEDLFVDAKVHPELIKLGKRERLGRIRHRSLLEFQINRVPAGARAFASAHPECTRVRRNDSVKPIISRRLRRDKWIRSKSVRNIAVSVLSH